MPACLPSAVRTAGPDHLDPVPAFAVPEPSEPVLPSSTGGSRWRLGAEIARSGVTGRRRLGLGMGVPIRNVEVHLTLPVPIGAPESDAGVGAELTRLWLIEQVRLRRLGVGKAA